MTPFVFALFFLSGACALAYEVSWVRALTLHFGSTTLAVSTVLTVYMGGLALGAHIVGRYVDRWAAPLTRYGSLELALALYALLTLKLFDWVLPLFGAVGASVAERFGVLSLLRFGIALALLVIPTALMGATLPVLSRYYALTRPMASRGAGLLYGINTVGGFAGTLLAGFVLLPSLGLRRTVLLAGSVNLLLGGVAWLAGRRTERREERSRAISAAEPRLEAGSAAASGVPILAAIAFTGFAAMVCEVAWTRVLTLIIGGSTYAFAVMLATFLVGLGVGAAAIATILRSSPASARRVFAGLALAAGALIAASSATFGQLPELFRGLFWSWDLASHPERVLWVQALLAAAVMLPPTLVMGGLFSAGARVMIGPPEAAGRQVALLYAWNTVGNILGASATAFLLIPALGIRRTLLTAVAAELIGAALLATRRLRSPRTVLVAAGACALLLGAVRLTPPWHHLLMTRGIWHQHAPPRPSSGMQASAVSDLLFYRDGLSATITVERRIGGNLSITTNGKVDGSSQYDMPNQRLLAHLPLLFHPDPRQVAVIGMGTGCTAGSAALHPVEGVTVIEIEAAMVEGARFFREQNHAVHENPRVDIRVTDGRLFLRLHPGRFDAIISEPSNPWLAGSSDLFTREFFELGAQALASGGVFSQWVQIYHLSPEQLRTLLRTFLSVFPHTYLAYPIPDTDILLLGSREPFALDVRLGRRRMEEPAISEDLADSWVEIGSFTELLARLRMGPAEVRQLAGVGPHHTDDHPVIAYRGPFDLYRETRDANALLLARHSRGIGPYLRGLAPASREREQFFRQLATAYRTFLGTAAAPEAAECDRLAGAIR